MDLSFISKLLTFTNVLWGAFYSSITFVITVIIEVILRKIMGKKVLTIFAHWIAQNLIDMYTWIGKWFGEIMNLYWLKDLWDTMIEWLEWLEVFDIIDEFITSYIKIGFSYLYTFKGYYDYLSITKYPTLTIWGTFIFVVICFLCYIFQIHKIVWNLLSKFKKE